MRQFLLQAALFIFISMLNAPSWSDPSGAQPPATTPQEQQSDITEELFDAAQNHKPEALRALLDQGTDVNARNKNGFTPLMSAAGNGLVSLKEKKELLDTVTVLLDKGADVNAKTEKGHTALMAAANRGHTEIVQLLLDKGADLKAGGEHGRTALEAAVSGGYADTVKLLLDKGAGIDAAGNKDPSYAMKAAFDGKANILRLFLERGMEVDQPSEKGATMLMRAACNGKTAVVSLLLDKGAAIDQKNKRGQTPLMCAAEKGDADTVRLLLAKGADDDETDEEGNTALERVEDKLPKKENEYSKKQAEKYKNVIALLDGSVEIDHDQPYQPTRLIEAANKGMAAQRAELGRVYYYGLKGVPQNLPEAYYWFSVCDYELANAAINGRVDFDRKVKELEKMAKEQGGENEELQKKAMMTLLVDPKVRRMCNVFTSTLNKKMSAEEREKVLPRIEDWKEEHPLPVAGKADASAPGRASIDELIPLAEAGNKEAQYKLGLCYDSPHQCDLPAADELRHYDHRAEQELTQEGQSTKRYEGLDLDGEYALKAFHWLEVSSDDWMKNQPAPIVAMQILAKGYMGLEPYRDSKPDYKKACSLMLEMLKNNYKAPYKLMADAPWNPEAGKEIESYAWQAVSHQASYPDKPFRYFPKDRKQKMSEEDLAKAQARGQEYIGKYLTAGAPLCSPDSLGQ